MKILSILLLSIFTLNIQANDCTFRVADKQLKQKLVDLELDSYLANEKGYVMDDNSKNLLSEKIMKTIYYKDEGPLAYWASMTGDGMSKWKTAKRKLAIRDAADKTIQLVLFDNEYYGDSGCRNSLTRSYNYDQRLTDALKSLKNCNFKN